MNKLLTGMQGVNNVGYTENGAVTHKSTLNMVLDYFATAAAKRGQDNTAMFMRAYAENPLLALKVAFYIRDVRGGQGERETFRQALRWLKANDPVAFNKMIVLVPIYGRWDDVLEFVDSSMVKNMVLEQLTSDNRSDHPSLLAKWMPSENASSKDTVKLANKWINALGMSKREYRKMLVTLRRKIVLVESLMSAQAFGDINYEHVPSKAAKLYRKAFNKRDGVRYGEYIAAVNKGEKKISAGAIYPYELIGMYVDAKEYSRSADIDATLEAQWKALPNYAESEDNALVMVDVSGSMFQTVAQVENMPIKVAVSLGIYIAERNHGAFRNNFITFTGNPALVTLRGFTLRDKVDEVFNAGVGYNTNIQAAFDMLLNTAVRNRVPASDMPTKIYIVSDMEFDSSSVGGNYTNFDVIKRKYAAAGYEMPTLIFWNVAARGNNMPVTQNEKGVYLVSGASPSIFKATINAKAITPLDMMLETINVDRYAAIGEALNS